MLLKKASFKNIFFKFDICYDFPRLLLMQEEFHLHFAIQDCLLSSFSKEHFGMGFFFGVWLIYNQFWHDLVCIVFVLKCTRSANELKLRLALILKFLMGRTRETLGEHRGCKKLKPEYSLDPCVGREDIWQTPLREKLIKSPWCILLSHYCVWWFHLIKPSSAEPCWYKIKRASNLRGSPNLHQPWVWHCWSTLLGNDLCMESSRVLGST